VSPDGEPLAELEREDHLTESERIVERAVVFRPRSLLITLGVLLGVAAALEFLLLAQSGLTLIAIALFLALALNPAVAFFERRGLSRGMAVATVYVLALIVLALLGLVFVPPLVEQIGNFIDAVPDLVDRLTKGRGPLGFLESDYHVVEKARSLTAGKNSDGLTGAAGPAFDVLKGVATTVIGLIIIAFLTLFMLLEGPEWRARMTELIPHKNRPRVERIGSGIYGAVGGFVTGNLLASLLAGVFATVLLLVAGVPYAFPLGLFVVIVELIPYVGPLVVTILLGLVAFTVSFVAGVAVVVALLAYHMIEGHSLRPLIYGRALKLSPLAVLIAIVLGAEIAGILGTLVALPIAGSIQVIVSEFLGDRNQLAAQAAGDG
jgi:predicted PurR-regulated permease PerM